MGMITIHTVLANHHSLKKGISKMIKNTADFLIIQWREKSLTRARDILIRLGQFVHFSALIIWHARYTVEDIYVWFTTTDCNHYESLAHELISYILNAFNIIVHTYIASRPILLCTRN